MRIRPVFLVAPLLLAACSPSEFDNLTGGQRDSATHTLDSGEPDADSFDGDVDFDGEVDTDGETWLDAEVDADAGLDMLDASDGEVGEAGSDGEAGATPPDGGNTIPLDEAGCPIGLTTARPLKVVRGPTELARLKHPANVLDRDLQAVELVGNKHVWLFGTTEPKDGAHKPPYGSPSNWPSAAVDDTAKPWLKGWVSSSSWTLAEPLDNRGLPHPLVSYPAAELPADMNEPAPALFPSSMIRNPADANRGIIFLQKYYIFASIEVRIADINTGGTQATLRTAPLFSGDDPKFAFGPIVDGGTFFKLFACPPPADSGPLVSCYVARAPLAKLTDRTAYEAGTRVNATTVTWSKDLNVNSPIFQMRDTNFSISFNRYLNQYVLVHSDGTSGEALLRTSDKVEGPWSAGVRVKFPVSPVSAPVMAREQPRLTQECGKKLIVSYLSPTVISPPPFSVPTQGATVLTAIELE